MNYDLEKAFLHFAALEKLVIGARNDAFAIRICKRDGPDVKPIAYMK